ncbi:hypothetical protein N9C24_04880 [Gammaproteobacteria bacterium]|nr:hypothetical protein [Gammaproteobacteria bacterium]
MENKCIELRLKNIRMSPEFIKWIDKFIENVLGTYFDLTRIGMTDEETVIMDETLQTNVSERFNKYSKWRKELNSTGKVSLRKDPDIQVEMSLNIMISRVRQLVVNKGKIELPTCKKHRNLLLQNIINTVLPVYEEFLDACIEIGNRQKKKNSIVFSGKHRKVPIENIGKHMFGNFKKELDTLMDRATQEYSNSDEDN